MTYAQFYTQATEIVSVLRSILNGVPGMLLDVLFLSVAFAVVLSLVNMVRGVRS